MAIQTKAVVGVLDVVDSYKVVIINVPLRRQLELRMKVDERLQNRLIVVSEVDVLSNDVEVEVDSFEQLIDFLFILATSFWFVELAALQQVY